MTASASAKSDDGTTPMWSDEVRKKSRLQQKLKPLQQLKQHHRLKSRRKRKNMQTVMAFLFCAVA